MGTYKTAATFFILLYLPGLLIIHSGDWHSAVDVLIIIYASSYAGPDWN